MEDLKYCIQPFLPRKSRRISLIPSFYFIHYTMIIKSDKLQLCHSDSNRFCHRGDKVFVKTYKSRILWRDRSVAGPTSSCNGHCFCEPQVCQTRSIKVNQIFKRTPVCKPLRARFLKTLTQWYEWWEGLCSSCDCVRSTLSMMFGCLYILL